jgi:hypothetical protein
MANTLADHSKIVEVSKNFRDYLIPLDHPRLHPSDRDARTHGKGVLGNEQIFLTPVAKGWLEDYQKPYHGFTRSSRDFGVQIRRQRDLRPKWSMLRRSC